MTARHLESKRTMFVRTESDISEANREAIRWPRINRPSRVERRSSRRRPSARNERRPIGGLRQVQQKSLGALTVRFRNALKKGVEGIIEAGRVVVEAKETLDYGQYTDWVVGELRFGEPKVALRKAAMLRYLAENEVISKSCHWHALPPSPRTLWELTQIRPTQRLLKLIANGKVNSGMTREEAVDLREGGSKARSPVAPLKCEIAVLVDVCIEVGGADCVLGHIRRLHRARQVPLDKKFDQAVLWVKHQATERRQGDE
jgi:hypothetical protein